MAGSGDTLQDGKPVGDPDPSPNLPIILVLDDEEEVGIGHARMLQRANFRADTCLLPALALERIGAGERFAAVLCDLRMPGMGGVEFFKRAELLWPELRSRIVFISGAPMEDDLAFITEAKLPLMKKPTSASLLIAEVTRVAALPPP